MKDLSLQSGLPITLDEKTGEIYSASPDVIMPTAGKRTPEHMQKVTSGANIVPERDYVYVVYRGVHYKKHINSFIANTLRYNIISILGGTIGGEFIKTLGHFHSTQPGTYYGYPEIYEILSGEALFLIQKMDAGYTTVTENYILDCKQGEKTVIPSNFGHVTINVIAGPLVLANVMTTNNVPDYKPYEKFGGASYKLFSAAEGKKVRLEKNEQYAAVPELARVRPKDLGPLKIPPDKRLYQLVAQTPKLFAFISDPKSFANQLTIRSLLQ